MKINTKTSIDAAPDNDQGALLDELEFRMNEVRHEWQRAYELGATSVGAFVALRQRADIWVQGLPAELAEDVQEKLERGIDDVNDTMIKLEEAGFVGGVLYKAWRDEDEEPLLPSEAIETIGRAAVPWFGNNEVYAVEPGEALTVEPIDVPSFFADEDDLLGEADRGFLALPPPDLATEEMTEIADAICDATGHRRFEPEEIQNLRLGAVEDGVEQLEDRIEALELNQ